MLKEINCATFSLRRISEVTEIPFYSEAISFTDFDMQPEEEIAKGGPCLWLYDYLRRSKLSGFILPLSGGIDSASVACIVFGLCQKLYEKRVLREVQQLLLQIGAFKMNKDNMTTDGSLVKSPKDICSFLLTTIYLPNKGCSSDQTQNFASGLASEIGSQHYTIPITNIVSAALDALPTEIEDISVPGFSSGKDWKAQLAMQNLQARSRLLITYLASQSVDGAKGKIVLSSSNADECLTGYLTKYDCSSGDINPIGAISKEDLKRVVEYMGEKFKLSSLDSIYNAPPTAELKPLENGKIQQTDEEDMGLTYKELSEFGKLRSDYRCGPFAMFQRLCLTKPNVDKLQLADKVKRFFTRYAKNRHKMTVLTPACHADSYSPDDNRHDLRPFLMPVDFEWQFQKIDSSVGINL